MVGAVPPCAITKVISAEALEKGEPGIVLSKDEKDAGFFFLPGKILVSIFAKSVYFSTGKTTGSGQSAAASPV